jgi:hypothetical protein
LKIHTTNYTNSFIEVAEDCTIRQSEVPPKKDDSKSIARHQFEMIKNNPYKYSSDEVIFQLYADRKNLLSEECEEARKIFFSKGQACLRSSSLAKRYGWGIHFDQSGKIALYGMETLEYQTFINDPTLKKIKAMRSKKNVRL